MASLTASNLQYRDNVAVGGSFNYRAVASNGDTFEDYTVNIVIPNNEPSNLTLDTDGLTINWESGGNTAGVFYNIEYGNFSYDIQSTTHAVNPWEQFETERTYTVTTLDSNGNKVFGSVSIESLPPTEEVEIVETTISEPCPVSPVIGQSCSGGIVFSTSPLLIAAESDQRETNDWQTSINDCEAKDENGANDWRLPTIEELESLYEVSQNIDDLNNSFSITRYYWSSTENPILQDSARFIFWESGRTDASKPKDEGLKTRCIR